MKKNPNKLILVEGLTGLGKSTLSHWLARQFVYNGRSARWIHEGDLQHPVATDMTGDAHQFMTASLAKWRTMVDQLAQTDERLIIEASCFNNLIETLFVNRVNRKAILAFYQSLHRLIQPANPALIYLSHPKTEQALQINFDNRGAEFQAFVEGYVSETAVAKQNGWAGLSGMRSFWQAFVELTDTLFNQTNFDKLRLDVSVENWERRNQQTAAFFHLTPLPEPTIDPKTAVTYIGQYHLDAHDHICQITFKNGFLTIDLFQGAEAKLIHKENGRFLVERWLFELQFTFNDQSNGASAFVIGGQDVDYFQAVGLTASRIAS